MIKTLDIVSFEIKMTIVLINDRDKLPVFRIESSPLLFNFLLL